MGVYGTTYYKKAFNGLGKPSIKLEFENNDDLLDFQQRMQEANDGGDNLDDTPDGGGNFTPAERLRDAMTRLAYGQPYLKATKGGEASDEEPVVWNEDKEEFEPIEGADDEAIKESEILLKNLKKGIIDDIKILRKSHGQQFSETLARIQDGIIKLKILVDGFHHNKLSPMWSPMPSRTQWEHRQADDFVKIIFKPYRSEFDRYNDLYEKFGKKKNFDWQGLGAPGDLYLVRDMRTRSRKEPGELLANKNLKFEKQEIDTIKNFNKELYAAPTLANGNKEINGKTYYPVKLDYKNNRYISTMYLFIPKIYNASENKMRGSWRPCDVVIDADKLYNIERSPYGGGFQAYEDEATLVKNSNDALRQAFADKQRNVDYFKEQIEKEKNSPWKSDGMIAKYEKYLKEAYKELKYFIMFYANYGKYPAWIISEHGDYPAKLVEDIPEGYIDKSIFAANLAAPADDLGRAGASDALYNNNDILDCRGLKPTYKILDSYDAFFAPAQHAATFAGVGLSDTKKLIAEICRAHYKDCARIAQHLKGDNKLQSAFNLWHWMRHNIRYEYDREGREEVRTPLRTWADRRRGVDCDCLSVFAWCVLKCMGYDPAFELVSFNGKAAPSHILVNLDGIRLDRVWFVFNALPPGVTGTEIYRIKTTNNSILAGLFN